MGALILAAAVAAGCASTSSWRSPAGGEDPARAAERARISVERAQARLADRPDDPSALRDLGVGLYGSGRFEESLQALERAQAALPRDRRVLFFRARALDTLHVAPRALEAYGAYLGVARGKDAEAARARMEQLRREAMREDAARAVRNEEALSTAAVPESSVAVPDFANPASADTLRPVAKGLAAMIVTDLAQVGGLRVLERQRLSALLAELDLVHGATIRVAGGASGAGSDGPPAAVTTTLGQQQRLAALLDPATGRPYYQVAVDGLDGPAFREALRAFQQTNGLQADGVAGPRTREALEAAWDAAPGARPDGAPGGGTMRAAFDPAFAPRIGRLLGARNIIQGAVLPLGDRDLQLRADLLPGAGGAASDPGASLRSSDAVEGRFTDLLRLEKDLVYQILDLLEIRPTREERKRIDRLETENLASFLAWAHGLDLEDAGRRDEALLEYRRAIELDPGWTRATNAAAVLGTRAEQLRQLDQSASSPPAAGEAASRATASAANVGMGPLLEGGLDTPQTDPVVPDVFRGPENIRIIIVGEVPHEKGGRP